MSNNKKFNSTLLSRVYTGCIAALAVITLSSHLYVNNVKKTKEDLGAEINLTGRQRMLSQLITKNILILSDARMNDNAVVELENALRQFKQVQLGLKNGDASLGLKKITSVHYIEQLNKIEHNFKTIVELTDLILGAGPSEREIIASRLKNAILTNEIPYRLGMDNIVNDYVEETNAFDQKITILERTILILNLSMILGIGLFIFRPLARHITNSYQSLEREKILLDDIIDKKTSEIKILASAIEQSPLATIITDENVCIRYANPAFTKITGYAPEEVIGRNPSYLKSGLTDDSVYKALWDTITNKKTWYGVLLNKHKNGKVMSMFATIAPIVDNTGETCNYIGIQQDISKRLHEEKLLAEKDALLELILNTVPDGIITMSSHDSNVVSANRAAYSILGINASTLDWKLEQFISRKDLQTYRRAIKNITTLQNTISHTRIEVQTTLTSCEWLELSISAVHVDKQNHITISFRNITDQKLTNEKLRISAVAFETQEGIFVTDKSGRILEVNKAFTNLTGFEPLDVIGRYPSLFKSGKHDSQFYMDMQEELKKTHVWQGEIWNKKKNGDIYPQWQTITAVLDDSGEITHYVSVFTDITLRKQTEEHIKNLAYYDTLTKLPNRRLILERIQQSIDRSSRNSLINALLFIDLDNFKNLNDTQGHDKGDILLQQVASRLKSSVRKNDTVARLSGDEFVILFEELGSDYASSAMSIENTAASICKCLNVPYILKSGNNTIEYTCSASIGITLFDSTHTIEEILKHADVAMYQSKAEGKNTVSFFDPSMQSFIQEKLKLESDLRRAIDLNEIYPVYQLQVDNNKRPVGLEALVRWRHKELGIIPPIKFVPLAEESGLINKLGLAMMDNVCRDMQKWVSHPVLSQLEVALNISAKQLRSDTFIQEMQAVFNKYDIEPHKIKIELTESTLLEDTELVINRMQQIQNIGCKTALDDFGTGYSSLSYLRNLPLNQLKIDRSFIEDIVTNVQTESVASIIIMLGYTLKMETLAEGIETEAQFEILKNYGCQVYQGYFFSKPITEPELVAFIDSSQCTNKS